jgi:hypothetical protein
VDEAQILGDQGEGFYSSTSSIPDLRPILSPILHGFRDPTERAELTVSRDKYYCIVIGGDVNDD